MYIFVCAHLQNQRNTFPHYSQSAANDSAAHRQQERMAVIPPGNPGNFPMGRRS